MLNIITDTAIALSPLFFVVFFYWLASLYTRHQRSLEIDSRLKAAQYEWYVDQFGCIPTELESEVF